MLTVVFGSITWQRVFVAVLLFVFTFTISLAIVSFILVNIHLITSENRPRDLWSERGHPCHIRSLEFREGNLLGASLSCSGFLYSIPAVPGREILTIRWDIMLLGFSRKRDLEYSLVKQAAGSLKRSISLRHQIWQGTGGAGMKVPKRFANSLSSSAPSEARMVNGVETLPVQNSNGSELTEWVEVTSSLRPFAKSFAALCGKTKP